MKKSKSKYKAKILEKMRILNEQLRLLSDILKECQQEEAEEENEEK